MGIPKAPSRTDTLKRWQQQIAARLVGRTIKSVEYQSDGDVSEMMWARAAVVLVLDDGTRLYPSQDEEGNGAGAIFTNLEDLPILPSV